MWISEGEKLDLKALDTFARIALPDAIVAELFAARKAAATAYCNCGYLLPSHSATDPKNHSVDCNYRKTIEDDIQRINEMRMHGAGQKLLEARR
jgi:hypothetical protein